MIIGIDMLGLQSSSSRMRGIGRYCFHLLQALFERHADHEYVLYGHGGLPRDGLPRPRLGRWRGSPGEPPTLPFDMDRLTQANPDDLDVLLTLNHFEAQNPRKATRGRDRLRTAAIIYDLMPMQFQDRYFAEHPTGLKWFSRWTKLLNAQDLLLTISESTRADLLEMLRIDPGRVVTIGTASDPGFFVPDPDGRGAADLPDDLRALGIAEPFLFNVSGDDDRKNAAGLIEAFARLPRRLRASHQLVIACGLPSRRAEALRALARERGVIEQLVLTGPISDEALRRLYQRCAAFVFPSLYEGFGIPILEAMHCGAPVIAGNSSAQVEVVEGAGLLVNATDPSQIAEKIELILEDSDIAGQLREQSLARASEFAWAHVADRLAAALVGLAVPEVSPRRRRPAERPRVVVVAPVASPCPDHARAVERLAEGLLETYAVDLYHESRQVPPLGLRSDRIGCFHHSLFGRNATYKQYRAVLCHLGNSPEYSFVLDLLEEHRAIAVLQDFGLARLQFDRAIHRGGGGAFLDVVRSCHGDRADALLPALGRLADDPGALLPALDALGIALNRRVFERAAAVVVTSASVLDRSRELTADLLERAVVIPPGIDPAGFDPNRRAAVRAQLGLPLEALVVGAFEPARTGRRAEVVLEAVQELWARRPDTHLLLVSTAALPDPLAARIPALGGGGRIRSFGRRSLAERDELMAAVDVAVLSGAPGLFETPGPLLATLLAAGVPVILDELGDVDDELKPFVLRYDGTEESPAQLRDQLAAVAEAPATASSAWKVVARRRSWDRSIASYVELIERCHDRRLRSVSLAHRRARSPRYPVAWA